MHHEFRLYWRTLVGNFSSIITAIFLVALLHLIAIPLALAIRHFPALPPEKLALLLTMLGGFVLLLMTSRGLISAVQALYARGDMDLLLSSPLEPRSIIGVRTTVIAASVTIEFAVLIWPFANVFVLFGMLAWAKAYILLPALGALAASFSLVLALSLFHLFGARRTRVIAQVMSALIAGGFMIVAQLPNIMAKSAGRAPPFGARGYAMQSGSIDHAFLTPAFAVLDGFLPTLAFALACAAIFTLTSRQLAGSFIRASVASSSISVGKRSRRPGAVLRFHANTHWILILKELRLIWRDPWLLTQLLQQSIFIFPLGVVLWRESGKGLPVVWGAAILLAGLTASALAWITVAAEDVPELVAAAPWAPRQIMRMKLQSALLPVLPIVVLPLLVLWRSHAWLGFSIAACSLGSAVSCALLNVRDRPPGRRRDFRLRNKGNASQGFLELGVITGWVGICALMVLLSPWR
jgi:ABC-2 type transport system permease protein